MTEKPASIARQAGRAVEADIKPETRVLYFADTNHFRGDNVYGTFLNREFWDEIRKNGKDNVAGLEYFPAGIQSLLNACYEGKVSAEEMQEIFDENFSLDSGQYSAEDIAMIRKNSIDLMKDGVPIVGLNNMQGFGNKDETNANQIALSQVVLDNTLWFRGVKDEFKADPNGFALQLIEKGDDLSSSMSEEQKAYFTKYKRDILDKIEGGNEVSATDIRNLHKHMDPRIGNLIEVAKRNQDINFDINHRRSADDDVVDTLTQTLSDKPNRRIYMLHGVSHAGGPDGMMKKMERAGIPSELVVPYWGKDHFKCLKPDSAICMDAELLQENIRRMHDTALSSTPHTKIPDLMNDPDKKIRHIPVSPAPVTP